MTTNRKIYQNYRNTLSLLSRLGLKKLPYSKKLKKSLDNLMIQFLKKDCTMVQGNRMHLDKNDSLNLSINGIYEKTETQFVKNEIKKNSTVLDIGANIGYYTLIFAKAVGSNGKVYSFEPEPNNFKILSKNVMINNYKNIILENKAVGDYNGQISLYISNMASGMHRIYRSKYCTNEKINVNLISLDNYFQNHVPEINLIKIDVEGSELGVLQGMRSLLTKNDSLKILMEFNPSSILESGNDPKEILKFISKNNFTIKYRNDDTKEFEKIADPVSLLEKFKNKGTNLILTK